MTEQRGSFWQYGFNTDVDGYTFMKKLNLIRKRQHLAFEDMETVATIGTAKEQLVLRRGGTKGTYAFLNNIALDASTSTVEYCLRNFPAADPQHVWVDGISGVPAIVDTNC